MFVIYLITNSINTKKYVGQTAVSLKKRWARHGEKSKSSSVMPITKAIQKYGKNNFCINQIDRAETLEEANEKEVYWANFYNCFSPTGYNLKAGGRKYSTWSQEIRNKIGKSNTGKKASKETIKKLSESHMGHVVKEETKEKLRLKFKGQEHHENTKRNAVIKNSKMYLLLSPNNEEVGIIHMANFCKEHKLQKTNMSELVNGKCSSYKGWKLIKVIGYIRTLTGSKRNPLK